MMMEAADVHGDERGSSGGGGEQLKSRSMQRLWGQAEVAERRADSNPVWSAKRGMRGPDISRASVSGKTALSDDKIKRFYR